MGAAKRFYGDRKSAPTVLLPEDRVTQPTAIPEGYTPSACPGWYRCPDGQSYTANPAVAPATPTTPDAPPPRGRTTQAFLFD